MVVLGIALVLLATLLFPLAERAGSGVQRAKAAQLGQAVLAELAGRRLDINTPPGGGEIATLTCCSGSASVCAAAAADPVDPSSWLLLDRFDGFSRAANELLPGEDYAGFWLRIGVGCSAPAGWLGAGKLITLEVEAANGESFAFAQLRGNF
ncbi:hypothetical protein GCM10023333_39910 [Ferrimonas pelagia]|uniref:MSHA biogenesis protein MshC n=2 Tax=Ferrimonas pelagia TaxID=1177826 RepID=A0ABP9FGU2_9GAMM